MQVLRRDASRPFVFWCMVTLVFGLVLLCYWPALHGDLLWDDPAHVPRPELRSWHGLSRIWFDVGATQQYYPVLFSAFWIEHHLWGDRTLGYHLLNLLLHVTSCCLLAVVLQRLRMEPAAPTSKPPARDTILPCGAEWFAAIIFAVHPVFVESVAWITEQKNTLSLVFYLCAALAYLNLAEHRRRRSYWLASGLFLVALLTKTVTATLPAALLVVLWWKNGKLSWRRDVRPLVPWFAAAIAVGVFVAWVERRFIGAEGAHFDFTLVQRLLLAGRTFWFYLGKLVWPADLAFYYTRWDVARDAAGWAGYLVAAVAVTALLWMFRRQSRGPLAAWLLYAGSLFPFLGFFNAYFFEFSYVNDHSQYLPSLSIIVAVTGGIALVLARMPTWARTIGGGIGAILIGTLALMANHQSRQYLDNETLFRATIAKTPGSWMAHHVLAVTLSKSPSAQVEAIAQYEKALTLKPDHPDAHLGLAVELAKLPGRKAEAIAHYERAIELRPNYAEAHNNLGVELAALPDRQLDAIAHFEAALRAKPDFARAHINLANTLSTQPGRLTGAIDHYEAALKIDPALPWVHLKLALCFSGIRGRETDAVAHGEEALRIDPSLLDAYNSLAIIHAQQGNLDKARSLWEQALQRDPNYSTARKNLDRLNQMRNR